ncbi:MAG: 3-phosphoshikimate 1-carboxyvinyltransferase [Lachnospirales bacterium]
MDLVFEKSVLNGSVQIPPSKSIAHRAIIASSIAVGTNYINNISYSDDILSTISAMENFGVVFEKEYNRLKVVSKGLEMIDRNFYFNESGSTVRFVIPLALGFGGEFYFDGDLPLRKRPLSAYFEMFEDHKIQYDRVEPELNLPLKVKGKLENSVYYILGDMSSQFITGMLFGLSNVKGESVVGVLNALESKRYIDLTISVLKDFGCVIENIEYQTFLVKKSEYNNIDYTVEGDYSQVAFFVLAGAIGRDIIVKGLNINSIQGDKDIIGIFEKFGGKVTKLGDGYIFHKSKLKGVSSGINVNDVPDLAPVIFALASIANGETKVYGIERLRIKESDRAKTMAIELSKLGANVKDKGSYMQIKGVRKLKGGVTINSHNDHRVAMTLAVLSSICNEKVTILGCECVQKSYPKFFEDLKEINSKFSEL